MIKIEERERERLVELEMILLGFLVACSACLFELSKLDLDGLILALISDYANIDGVHKLAIIFKTTFHFFDLDSKLPLLLLQRCLLMLLQLFQSISTHSSRSFS